MKEQNNRQQAHENESIWAILIIGIVCIIFFLIGMFTVGKWCYDGFEAWSKKPVMAIESKYPDSLVIIDRGDYGYIRFYHERVAPDTTHKSPKH